MLQIGRSLVRSQLVSLEFFVDINSFRSQYGPGVDSASNRNKYQEHFLGVKIGRCVRLTNLLPSCAVVMKSGNFNFLEPSGLLQACNGTDLPLPFRTNLYSWYSQHAESFVSETRTFSKIFRRISNLPSCRITDFSNMRSRTLINFTNNITSGYILLG